MLTPVSQVSSQSATGGNLRSAASVGVADRQSRPVIATSAEAQIQAPAGDNASVERLRILLLAAGVTQQGLLQKLADIIARSLRIDRLPGESADKFLARLAGELEKLPVEKRLLLELRTGLKPPAITFDQVAKAFRDPAGQQAARLAALIETPDFNAVDAPAKAVLKSYLDDGAGENRSTETLQAQAAAKGNSKGQNIFSPNIVTPQTDPKDIRNLQTVLAKAFTEAEEPQARNPEREAVVRGGPDAPTKIVSRSDGMPGIEDMDIADGAHLEARIAPGAKLGSESLAVKPQAAPRQQTMMIMRGLTEVIGNLAERAVESLRMVVESQPVAKPGPTPGQQPSVSAPIEVSQDGPAAIEGRQHERASPVVKEIAAGQFPLPAVEDLDPADAHAKPAVAAALLARQGEAAEAIAEDGRSAQRFGEPVPVGYATVPYPVEDNDEKYPAKRKGRGSGRDGQADDRDEEKGSGEGENTPDHHRADADDDRGGDDEEEMLELNRSSTDADRAFRHYQRMRGF